MAVLDLLSRYLPNQGVSDRAGAGP